MENYWNAANCEITLILTWSSTCFINISTGAGTLAITHAKLYVPVVTLSTNDNENLLKQLKSGFKSKVSIERQKQYLNYDDLNRFK